jgi:HEAT repeat protein
MRIIVWVLFAILVSGCGKTEPTLAGGKPVSYWVDALQSSDVTLRKKAVFKLGNVGPSDPAAFPAVVVALRDKDPGVRCQAIQSLMKFGLEGRQAIPILKGIHQHDRNDRARTYAGKALDRLQSEH